VFAKCTLDAALVVSRVPGERRDVGHNLAAINTSRFADVHLKMLFVHQQIRE
jgi:hypothetical protein